MNLHFINESVFHGIRKWGRNSLSDFNYRCNSIGQSQKLWIHPLDSEQSSNSESLPPQLPASSLPS
jgi:hypothetical protein